MKKLFFTLLTLCLCGTTWAADKFSVKDETTGVTFYFNITSEEDAENPTVEVTFQGDSHSAGTATTTYVGDIVIPKHVTYQSTTYAVTGIGEMAFRDCHNVSSLTIPNTIQYIGSQGCAYMGGAESADPNEGTVVSSDNPLYMIVTIEGGENVSPLEIKMGTGNIYTFKRSYIDTLYVNRNIVLEEGGNIQYAPFHDNAYLKNAVLGEGVTDIIGHYFNACTALTSITLPEGVKSIGTHAFYNTSIKKIVIPSTVETFGTEAFGKCENLHSVILLAEDPSEETLGSSDFEQDAEITFYAPRGFAAVYYASQWRTNVVEGTSGDPTGFSFNFFSIDVDSATADENNDYYATYYMDQDNYEVEIPGSCSIYAITSVKEDGDTKQAETQVLGSLQEGIEVIPNGTPLFIQTSTFGTHYFWKDYYEENEEGKEIGYFSEQEKQTITVPEGNMLYGHSVTGTIETPSSSDGSYLYYKLSLDKDSTPGSIGFYWGNGGEVFEVPANKCWLAVPNDEASPTSSISISFKKDEGDTTGISSVESASETKVSGIYTIQGVRVSNMNQPGLYIVDGKKVLVK